MMVQSLPCMYPVLFVFMFQGVSGQKWGVILTNYQICAVTGSSVVIPCSFTHPPGLTVTQVFWTIKPHSGDEPPDLSRIPGYEGRVSYSADIKNNCTLTLRDVKRVSAVMYHPRIVTDNHVQNWLGQPGLSLSLTELSVWIPQPVIKGGEVKLSCNNSCRLKNTPTVIWRKNGVDIPDKQDIYTKINNNKLILQRVSTEDEGDYSCALKGFEGHPSIAEKLNVMFPPKNTSVSLRPSNKVHVGDPVTLTCSSDANPPVESYTWFKVNESTPVGSGQQYSITNIRPEDGGQYYCEARNRYGAENSSAVSVIAEVPPKEQNFAAFAIIGVIVVGVVVISCSIHIIRRRTKLEISVGSNAAGILGADAAGILGADAAGIHGADAAGIHGADAAGIVSADAAGGLEGHDGQYSTIQPHSSVQTEDPQGEKEEEEEEEVQYVTVYLLRPGQRAPIQPEVASTTIYCSVQRRT